MKKNQLIKAKQSLSERVTNLIWALALLIPLLILAGKAAALRPLFHAMLFITGWFCWSYTEYFFHRFVMHDSNQKKGLGKLLNHTHHHKDPEDIRINRLHRYVMIAGCIVLTIVSARADNYFTLFFGYCAGFSAYTLMHFILHQSWSAKLFPGLHRFHIHHHCKHPDKCFGVITTWWDYLFNTIPVTETEITERIKQFYYKKTNKKNKEAVLV